jgi:hypothetical protein
MKFPNGFRFSVSSIKLKSYLLPGDSKPSEIKNNSVLTNVQKWIVNYCADLGENKEPRKGIVFEARQGYKSKDSFILDPFSGTGATGLVAAEHGLAWPSLAKHMLEVFSRVFPTGKKQDDFELTFDRYNCAGEQAFPFGRIHPFVLLYQI